MTPEQQQRYERARAEAEAVRARLTMETNMTLIQARAPIRPPPRKTWLQRLRDWLAA